MYVGICQKATPQVCEIERW